MGPNSHGMAQRDLHQTVVGLLAINRNVANQTAPGRAVNAGVQEKQLLAPVRSARRAWGSAEAALQNQHPSQRFHTCCGRK